MRTYFEKRAMNKTQDAADVANHQKRLAWLRSANPKWNDGSPVDAADRKKMIEASESRVREYLNK